MDGFGGLLAFFSFLFIYIGVPIAIVLVLLWIYKIKINSDDQVKQNQEIIRLLNKLDK